MQKIVPFFWFDGKAEEAMNFYVKIFKKSKIKSIKYWPKGSPFPSDQVMGGEFVLEGQTSLRSLIHRIAAAIFIAVSVTHTVSLIVNRKLRQHWKEMLPTMDDPREALSGFAYNLGLGDKRPYRSSHSYVEKAEYWAVVWGAIVMIASGTLLWANNLAMKFLPKLWLDVSTSVHFYEAVLAALSLLESHEEAGAPVAGDPRTRRLLVGRFPYQVVYRLRDTEIVIVAFAHLKRRPDYWRKRA